MDGIVFIARLGSTRLKKKHLIKVLNQTFLEWMINRFMKAFEADVVAGKMELILATSDEPINKEFETALRTTSVKVFYGSVNNIPLRLAQCAKKYDLQNIISIDGDDILCSTQAAKKVIEELRNKTNNMWVKTSGLALGMNVAGYKRSVLEECCNQMGSEKLETGWGRVFNSFESETIKLGDYDLQKDLRFTLDYEEDAAFFKRIIEGLGERTLDISDQELVEYVIKNDLMKINKDVNDVYWNNFNNQMKSEN